ncbi:MAG: DUF1566 domain-containing protein, partial [Candidatus Riflebacteria bacterium]|nr:DUF1566 domain-containing protein [Candidatus Riflebacteria bacterium]
NATAGEVLTGRKAWVNGNEVTGAMPDRGAVTLTPGAATQTIAPGFHNGAGQVVGDANLVGSNIKAGTTIFGVSGSNAVTDSSSGNATAGEVLTGRKAWVNGNEVTGAMPDQGAVTLTPGAATQTIAPGFHNGAGQVVGDANLVGANIRGGTTIFGVTGSNAVTDTSSGNATAGEVLTGRKAWVNGSEVTGAMPDQGAVTLTPGAATQTIAAGFHNGAGQVVGDANLVSANIRAGTTIFGVVASSTVVDTSPANATAGEILLDQKAYVNGALVTGMRAGGVALTGGNFWPGGHRWYKPGNGTVVDCLTGLVWLSNVPHIARPYLATDGVEIDCMRWLYSIRHGSYGLTDNSQCGDWGMPSYKELATLWLAIPPGQEVGSLTSQALDNPYLMEYYWTSTPVGDATGVSVPDKVYVVCMRDGSWIAEIKLGGAAITHYVWPIRRIHR